MKRWLIGAGCVVILLLIGVNVSEQADLPRSNRSVFVMNGGHATPHLGSDGPWAEWVGAGRRPRPWRNPARRYRLTKKQRRRLRRRLRRSLAQYLVQPPLVAGPCSRLQPTGAWAPAEASGPAPAPAGPVSEAHVRSAAPHDKKALMAQPVPAQGCGFEPVTVQPVPVRRKGAGLSATSRYGRKDVLVSERRTYHAELRHCPPCQTPLRRCKHLSWRKTIQTMDKNLFVGSRGSFCPQHPHLLYLSAAAAGLSLPGSTYGLDVLVRIGYQRDYLRQTFLRIHQSLPNHMRLSERHVANLYRDYLALLACAQRLDVDKLKAAVKQYGGLLLAIDGLEPEGGQPQLWTVREVLTDTLLAAGWLPRVDEDTLKAFLAPVAALDLPLLATVSDKQRALVKALLAIWQNVPHQYCQAHYLMNAVDPLYQADQQMQTQLRKQVRAIAGPTLRQAQAEAKRRTPTEGSALVVTGLAANPPAELAVLQVETQAIPEKTSPGPLPDKSPLHAQRLSEAGVLVRERQPPRVRAHTASAPCTFAQTPSPTVTSKQSQTDKLVAAYASRLRSTFSRSGRKPFRLSGLHLYADLLTLLSSLQVCLTHLPDEPRLTCFAEAIRQALCAFEEEYLCLAEGYSWVLDISAILDAPLPQPADTTEEAPTSPNVGQQTAVQTELDAYLQRLQARTDLSTPLTAFRAHLVALTERYAPGLFHCYQIPGLPRTNNDLESLFGTVRRRTLCTVGPYRAQQLLHRQGAWLLFDTILDEHQQLENLQRVSADDFRLERRRMQQHQASRADDRRFRRQPRAYLAKLEAQAAAIARLE